jgi:hypothetical protein
MNELWRIGFQSGDRNNSDMLRQLQSRAADLLESLFILELEMRRSRTLEKKFEAYREFGRAVDKIDALRRDVEELVHHAEESILDDLDRKVSSVMRAQPYRILEWLSLYSDLRWYVGPATVSPLAHAIQC